MKKIFKAFAVIASLVAVFTGLSACTSDGVPPELDTVPKVIKYVSAQGTKPADKSVQSGYTLKAADLPDLSADGFTWGGWHVGSETGSLAEVGYKVTKNLTLVAKWTQQADTYTITYKFGDEVLTGLTPATYKSSDGTITLPTPTKEHYTFGGWYESASEQSGTAVTSFESSDKANKIFYAKFTEITHTVTLNIGTDENSVSFANNSETTKVVGEVTGWTLPSFTELGIADSWSDHVPYGWSATKQNAVSADSTVEYQDNAKVTPTDNITLYVLWKEGSVAYYTVKYEYEDTDGTYKEDASKTQENLTATLNEETTIEPSEDSKKANYTVPENQRKTFAQKSGNTVTFQYALVTHSVTFSGDGVSESAQTIKHGAKATDPTNKPSKEGYVFDGWYNGESAFDFASAIEADVTLTAHFTEITLEITGDTEIAATVDTLTLSETHTPTGDGYTVEWSVPANSCVTVSDATLTRTDDGITEDASVTVTATLKNGSDTLKTAEKTVTVKANKFTITHATSISNGSITAPTANSTAKVGETVTIMLSPSDGYTSNKPTVSGVDANSVSGSGNSYSYTFTMPAQNVEIGATFSAGAVEYTVKHLFQKVSGGTGENDYEANNSYADETKSGTVGSTTEAAAKTVEGFEAQTITQATIAASGTVVTVKYNRKNISLTFELEGGTTTTQLTDNKLTGLYGANVEIADPTREGHKFTSWSPALQTFPASDATYTAQWEKESYAVTIADSLEGGSIEAATLTDGKAEFEATVKLTVTPGEGKKLKEGTLSVKKTDGESAESEELSAVEDGDNQWTFTMPAYAVTVSAEFEDADE